MTEEPLETVASSVCCMYRDSLCRECSVLVFFSPHVMYRLFTCDWFLCTCWGLLVGERIQTERQ